MQKEVRSLNSSLNGNEYEVIHHQTEDGNLLIQMCERAPWGFNSLGFFEASREWVEANTTPLSPEHPFVQDCIR